MIRKLAVLTVFSVSALFTTAMIGANPIGAQDGAFPQARSNDKLLIPLIVSKKQTLSQPVLYDIRPLLAGNEIVSLRNELDKKVVAGYHASQVLNSSA